MLNQMQTEYLRNQLNKSTPDLDMWIDGLMLSCNDYIDKELKNKKISKNMDEIKILIHLITIKDNI